MEAQKIAFVGCGHIAHVHMRYLKKIGKTVTAVCDTSEVRAREFAEQNDIATVETSLDSLLDEHKLDVVHVLAPPHVHFPIVRQCLERKCHVVVEKPCCESLDEFRQLQALADENQVLLTVDHTRVFNPMVREIRQRLDAGRYGKIVRMEYVYDDPSIQRNPGTAHPVSYVKGAPRWFGSLRGGVMSDLIPHPVSVLLSFDPALEIEDTYGRCTRGLIEQLIVRLRSDESDALIQMATSSRPLKNALTLYCEKGNVTIDFRNLFFVSLPARNLPNIIARVLDTFSMAFQTQFRFFASIILLVLGKRHPYDGLDVLLESFYAKVAEGDTAAIEHVNAEKVTRLSEHIVSELIGPGESAAEIDASLMTELEPRLTGNAEALVTGGTGFIGSALVEKLSQAGHTIRVLARSPRSASQLPKQCLVKMGDIRSPDVLADAMQGVNTVYHCAAAMQGDWAEFYSATVGGTENLLRALAKSQVKKLVYVSSLGIIDYSRLSNGSTLDEFAQVEAQPDRRGSYTKAKKEAEDLVWAFKKKHQDIAVIVVRPGLVYGYENNPVLKNAGVLLGRTLVNYGLGNRQLGLIHVKNLAGFLAALGSQAIPDASAGPIHLVDREQPTVRQYIRYERQFGTEKLRVIYMPVLVWKAVFKLVDGGLWLIRRKNPDFSYRFNSNSRTLNYRSRFLEAHESLATELPLEAAAKDAIAPQPPECGPAQQAANGPTDDPEPAGQDASGGLRQWSVEERRSSTARSGAQLDLEMRARIRHHE